MRDGVPTVLLADLGEAVARFLVGLFPRDALPLAGALLAHALLRVAHAQRVVQLLRDGEAAPAQRALAEQVGVALDLHEAPVLDVPEQRAAAVALAARAREMRRGARVEESPFKAPRTASSPFSFPFYLQC